MSQGWTVPGLLAGFEEYLRRRRGLTAGTRTNYVQHARRFLIGVEVGGHVDPSRIGPSDVVAHVRGLTGRYRPATVELAASALRSFFRFLRMEGLRDDRLEDAVPVVPHRRGGLPRHLDGATLARLIAGLDVSTPRGLRDRAIIVLMARLGLRSGEVVALRLEDVDWREGTLHVRRRKSGHGAVLPLPHEVGQALVDYLRGGRPATATREVFVLCQLRTGSPISSSIVTRAIEHALDRAGIDAPVRGGNLLRHSLATDLLARGRSLPEIADLFGHRALTSTAIYARVDLAALQQVALPWPAVTPAVTP